MAKPPKVPKALHEYLSTIGARGGKARVARLTAKQRRESARRAALARWRKRRKGGL